MWRPNTDSRMSGGLHYFPGPRGESPCASSACSTLESCFSNTAKFCFVVSSKSLNLNSGADGVLQGGGHDLFDTINQVVGPVKTILGCQEVVNSVADFALGIWGGNKRQVVILT